MSLATYIKLRNARISSVLHAACPLEESEKFPCKTCLGEGVLATYTEFSRIRRGLERLTAGDGSVIVCADAMPCPSCSGTGLDHQAFFESVKNEVGV